MTVKNDPVPAQSRILTDDLVASEPQRAMKQAINALPRTEAEPILLAYFTKMTYRAVARQLDVSEASVQTLIRSGLIRLRASAVLRSQFEGNDSDPADAPVGG